ncbi:MAG TPA: hypothetical protein VGI82_09220 [Chitinophagaceae bacterium]|jgi:hypothetical protein
MKKVLLIYLILIAGILIWYYGVGKEKRIFDDANGKALKVSKHSPVFNESMEDIMTNYYKLTSDFVKGDTLAISENADKLIMALDSLKIDELKKDSSIFETAFTIWQDTRTELAGMLSDPSLQARRESFNLFSNELFTLLLTIRYDLGNLYWMECSSAFGEDTPGNWIGENEKSVNPYGKQNCEDLKKTIKPTDSTGKK